MWSTAALNVMKVLHRFSRWLLQQVSS